jgi:multiple sugar transport system permease protein/cellobiose transport system permease protein
MSIIALMPFYMMIMMGTYINEDLFLGIKLYPGDYFIQNFKSVVDSGFFRYYGNSLMVAIPHTMGAVLVSAFSGYAFAKFRFRGKRALFAFVLATIAIPSQVGLVGFVVEMKMMGWMNTLLPLIFPGMANAFVVFWMTQYISTAVPNEILESGRIDGCNDFGIFFRLVLPIIRPALICVSLLIFLWSWNNYMVPLVTISKVNLYTIPLSISLLQGQFRVDIAARILALAMGIIPMLIIFVAGSKQLIQGMTAGSVKG